MDRRPFDLRLLRVFDAVLKEGNVTLAATRLHMTQSAVSQALAKLRRAIGDPLFVRAGKAMVPTARALTMAPPLQQALELTRATLEASVGFDAGRSQRVFRIATTDYTLMELLPRLAGILDARAPGVDLVVSSVNLDRGFESLRQDQIDLLIAYFVVTRVPPSFRKRQLFRDSYVVLARRGHPRFRADATLAAFAEAGHIVVAPRDAWLSSPLDAALARRRLKRKIRIRVPHYLLVPYVVADSDLIATVPARVARYVKGKLPVNVYPLPLELADFKVEMAWDERHHHDPAHRWLRNLVHEVATAA